MINIENFEEFTSLLNQGGKSINASEFVAFIKNRNILQPHLKVFKQNY